MQTTPSKSATKLARANTVSGAAPDIAAASVPDTLVALHVNPDAGLASNEVELRRKESGYNEVAERAQRPFLQFLKKFF